MRDALAGRELVFSGESGGRLTEQIPLPYGFLCDIKKDIRLRCVNVLASRRFTLTRANVPLRRPDQRDDSPASKILR